MNANEILIMRADLFKDNEEVREALADMFSEGFSGWLTYFTKDSNLIKTAFAHMFILERFYVAVINNEIVGMVGFTNSKNTTIHLERKPLQQHLGIYKGFLASIFLKKEFETPMKNASDKVASIEFVATKASHRGKGIAIKIFQYILENTNYDEYVIGEVADTNIPAMNLYKKMGFVEFERKPIAPKKAKKIGINSFVSLVYKK